MHAMVTRRKMNPARQAETRQLAEADFWPTLRQAPGFVSFSLIMGEDGVNTAITVFESKAQAEAFQGDAADWERTLEEHGHQAESRGGGEVTQHFSARS